MVVQSQFIEMFGETKQVSIGSLFDTTSGGTPSRTKNSYYDGGNIPWLTSSEVGHGLIKKTESFITEDGLKNSSAKWVPKDSVVVAMYGATVGKVGLLEIPCTTNQAVCSILPNANVIPMFLLYAVKDKEEWMISQAAGAAQPNISQAVIRKMEIPIPPKEEQISFVEIAKQADKSKFDGLKSQFIELFGSCPMTSPLGEVVELMDDKRKPINDSVRQGMKTGELYPYYGATGQVDSINDYLTDETLLCIAEDCGNYNAGDESSYIITGKAWVNNHAHLVRPKEGICCITYLHYYLTISDLNEYVSGTTRKKMTQGSLVRIPVTLPPIGEQHRFASFVEQADKSKYLS